jgi:hypothetical protein
MNETDQFSSRDRSIAYLQSVRDGDKETYSTAEKLNAIKQLETMRAEDVGSSIGPGSLTRAELQAEIARCRAMLDRAEQPIVRQSVRQSKAKALISKG